MAIRLNWKVKLACGDWMDRLGKPNNDYPMVYKASRDLRQGLKNRSTTKKGEEWWGTVREYRESLSDDTNWYYVRPEYLKGSRVVSEMGHEISYEDWMFAVGYWYEGVPKIIIFDDLTHVKEEDRDLEYIEDLRSTWKEGM